MYGLDYRVTIKRTLMKLKLTGQDLEDATQDTIIRLVAFEDEDVQNPQALASKVAHGIGVNFIRERDNRLRLDDLYHSGTIDTYGTDGSGTVDEQSLQLEPLSKGSSPETMALVIDQLKKALASLTSAQANAIYLVDYMGYTFQEAADTREVSKASFHRMYQRAKGGLKRWGASQR